MVGISVAESNEWEVTLKYFNKSHEDCEKFPLKEKFNVNIDITIVDTEASGIAYVCKMNNVKIIIIKGISDFPTDESLSTKELSHEKQYNCFVQNIPIIMNKIFNDYIEKVI